ncbi:type II/IV secretion system ATPase subunit [Thermoplasma sp.]|uniref:type II/IV secretion system ATPase subunit n=1 Tax=Thermoplasma sp. TaxID=1973142 RepID=UPI0026117FDF|nr:type II/IV secretion system ATPase subunit [Thermoplasma sp.]
MDKGVVSDSYEIAISRNPHLGEYLSKYRDETGRSPSFLVNIDSSLKSLAHVDVIYPVGDPIFIHIYEKGKERRYKPIEPLLKGKELEFMDAILDIIMTKASEYPPAENEEEQEKNIEDVYKKTVSVGSNKIRRNSVSLEKNLYDKMLYNVKKEIIGLGPLEPLIRDSHIEDISGIGPEDVYIVHKIFGSMPTDITFGSMERLMRFSKRLSERVGRPVSDKRPIVDATLPDGSRLSIVYSTDISQRGPSFTIRKFSEIPLSIINLIKYNTMSYEEAAYLWLALEYGQSVFVCGETASGKTTVVNAIIPFIRPESKIFSAEDTPEIRAPQKAWQQLVTRESGAEESRVTLYDLLRTALRSRPNYIVVGEIRGAEGAMAFQAMQTGHPVISTFHASSVKKMIQRFTGNPINIPVTFMDNLNIVLIQQAVYVGGKFLRRTTSINEIEGYYEDLGGVATRAVFEWDPSTDRHMFRGMNNSYILEEKIAKTAGLVDTSLIYNELFRRAKILKELADQKITDYFQVYEKIKEFYEGGSAYGY